MILLGHEEDRRGSDGCRRALARGAGFAVVSVALWAYAAVAQTVVEPIGARVLLAGNESTLWLARVEGDHTVFRKRTSTTPFQLVSSLRAPLVAMAVARGQLYVFTEEGRMYSFFGDSWSRERDLPGRVVPLELAGSETSLYALLASPRGEELPRVAPAGEPPQTLPFDPGGAPLTLARYDPQGWVAVAPVHPAIDGSEPVDLRLGFRQDQLVLVQLYEQGRGLALAALDPNLGCWQPLERLRTEHMVRRFWMTIVARVPTLVLAEVGPQGAPLLHVRRLLGNARTAPAEWLPSTLQIDVPASEPGAAGPPRLDWLAAVGFNQQLALLGRAADGKHWLYYGRPDSDPTETAVRVHDVFTTALEPRKVWAWVQGGTFAVLLLLLMGLMVFRRNSMIAVLVLPDTASPALLFQRLAGLMIDLLPFVLVMAGIVGVDWRGGIGELTDLPAGHLPNPRTLAWWGYATGLYVVYATLLELLTQRTIGKMVIGTQVTNEQGRRPSAGQVLVRNAFRLIELAPPFWLLGFLVVLSRNRQRLGDIFARTLVVRMQRTAGA